MAALETPKASPGFKAPDFKLKATDGRHYSLADIRGPNGLLVMFICNHCPYVKATIERIASDCAALKEAGIGSVAVMPNDTRNYPDDSFENMKLFASKHKLPFPYAIDETQAVAKAYGAVCTPDFFGFNAKLELQYRGRLDESWQGLIPNPKRELLLAMTAIAKTGICATPQNPSIGCSIKWKEEVKAARA